MIKAAYLVGATLALATLLLSAAASAERSHDIRVAPAAHHTYARFMVAQTSHAPPGVPGSSNASGASSGSHASPPVPGSTDVGGSSADSHAPPPVPGSTNSDGGGSSGSHAPPPVPGGAALSGGNRPPPAPAGSSHAAPQVPMMGGNP